MSYFSRAATTIWHWTCWLGVTLFLVCASLLVTPVLAVWLALGFFPKRKSKPLTSQAQVRHRELHPYHSRPHLRRNGSDVFWEMPDGEIIPLEPLQASLVLQEVAEVVGAALCYEKTKLPR
jgi:hypothetical protein